METLVIQESSSEDEAINVDVWRHYFDSYYHESRYMTHFSYTTSSLTKTVFTGNHIQISSEVHRLKVHSWKNFNKLENTVSILVKFSGYRSKDATVRFLSGHLTVQSSMLSYPLMNRSVWFQNFVKRIEKSFLKIEVEWKFLDSLRLKN